MQRRLTSMLAAEKKRTKGGGGRDGAGHHGCGHGGAGVIGMRCLFIQEASLSKPPLVIAAWVVSRTLGGLEGTQAPCSIYRCNGSLLAVSRICKWESFVVSVDSTGMISAGSVCDQRGPFQIILETHHVQEVCDFLVKVTCEGAYLSIYSTGWLPSRASTACLAQARRFSMLHLYLGDKAEHVC